MIINEFLNGWLDETQKETSYLVLLPKLLTLEPSAAESILTEWQSDRVPYESNLVIHNKLKAKINLQPAEILVDNANKCNVGKVQ